MSKNRVSVEATVVGEALSIPNNAAASSTLVTPGRPSSLLELEDFPANGDENIVYPTGAKLYLTIISVMISCIIYGLDLTIIAVAVPSVTDDFKSIRDIGWYTAVYGLVGSAMSFL